MLNKPVSNTAFVTFSGSTDPLVPVMVMVSSLLAGSRVLLGTSFPGSSVRSGDAEVLAWLWKADWVMKTGGATLL